MLKIVHIHPMLVHFPIVLLMCAVFVDFYVLTRKGNLAAKDCWSTVGMGALVLGVLAAIVAAVFGDIALDAAVDLGFSKDRLEEHEEFGLSALYIFLGLALVRVAAFWRNIELSGARALIFVVVGLVGVGVLLSAAYHGGGLVYEIGVNVSNVTPVKP
jgi:uncharacterized membrane protein